MTQKGEKDLEEEVREYLLQLKLRFIDVYICLLDFYLAFFSRTLKQPTSENPFIFSSLSLHNKKNGLGSNSMSLYLTIRGKNEIWPSNNVTLSGVQQKSKQ